MRKFLFVLNIFLLQTCILFSQVGVNADGSTPDNSAMLDVKATDRGILIPRLTTDERNLIPSPEMGLLVYNRTENMLNYFNGTYWYRIDALPVSNTLGTYQAGGGALINALPASQPKPSAMLDIDDPGRGFLIPRTVPSMIPTPVEGLLIYETAGNHLMYYKGTRWITICGTSTGLPGAGGSQASLGVAIKSDQTAPDPSAILDVSATDRGVLVPRLTKTQRNEILPDTGLIIYNTGSRCFEFFNGEAWCQVITSEIDPPEAGTSIPSTTGIVWNWTEVPGATGYKWNTSNDYGTALDMGPATSYAETGLTCGTGYTRYAWAYNSCGYSVPVTLIQATSVCFTCGQPLVINHVAGVVAPVTKTVTYGTVTNIPGEPTKCWITSNLGADHQAASVNDATEASAGWYWQFNRKQGYKHDGTTRTPNTPWVTLINENTGWDPANDPCALELGNGWRLPTHEEWANVDAAGMWSSWYGPWGSGLKMHAGGYLYNENGNVYTRGSSGNFWSKEQKETYTGWGIFFTSSMCISDGSLKAFGLSVRCIHD